MKINGLDLQAHRLIIVCLVVVLVAVALVLLAVASVGGSGVGRRGSITLDVGSIRSGRLDNLGLAHNGRLDRVGDLGSGGELLLGSGGLVGSDGVGEVGLVKLDLLLDLGLAGGGGDFGGDVGLCVGVDLLNGEAATKGAGEGIVAAADGADVAGRATGAVQGVGHGNGHVEVLGLGLGETVGTGDVVGDGERGLASSTEGVTGRVHVAGIRTSAVGVDLVDSHCHGGASLDLCDGPCGQSVLGVLADIDVAANFCPSTLVGHVGVDLGVTDQRRILLARADAGAVSCKVVDYVPILLAKSSKDDL